MSNFITPELSARGETIRADIERTRTDLEGLNSDILQFSQRISTDSRRAIDTVNPDLQDTELGDEWPLTYDMEIASRLGEKIVPPSDHLGRVALSSELPADLPPQAFMSYKIHDNEMIEAYNTLEPRWAFTANLLGWVDTMQQSGWPMLVRLQVQDQSRVEVAIYEDTPENRTYFGQLTDASRLDAAELAEGYEPYTPLNERVLVDSSEFASHLQQP